MPKEVRYLLFSPEEVLSALLDYPIGSVAARPRPAYAPPPRLELFGNANGSVAAHLFYEDHSGALHAVDIGSGELLSALLTFCARMRIVLPRLGHKSLELMSDRLVMSSTLNTPATRSEADRGGVRYSEPEVRSPSMSAT
jgi:hypothetical protein